MLMKAIIHISKYACHFVSADTFLLRHGWGLPRAMQLYSLTQAGGGRGEEAGATWQPRRTGWSPGLVGAAVTGAFSEASCRFHARGL